MRGIAMIDAQDKALTDALATMTTATPETAAPTATRRASTRRTIIVPEDAPVTGYAVTVPGMRWEVEAASRGEAVLMALAMARVSNDPNHRNMSAYVFLWNYAVTDSEGVTVQGVDMRDEVQAARIAASNAKAGRE